MERSNATVTNYNNTLRFSPPDATINTNFIPEQPNPTYHYHDS